ncbi:hypothetical protein [Paraburkholderia adhaesiva]|uniref:hypothetical protein n=1 Tax=Paraburkholderia adhaesiva TaxID=2883244 RepID=UPI001F1AF0D8|nr:hypothetical protein [Paraburkholderia adhaesiva]
MRFYELNLYQPDDTTKPWRTWTSFPNGKFDPGALNIEFDIPVMPFDTPAGGSTITIHGIALKDLAQSQQFGVQYLNNTTVPGKLLELKGGMGPGLPLANSSQQGVLLKGTILNSFGAWQGTEMHLDFVVYPAQFTTGNPGNFVLNWQKGQQLSQALQNCLSVAYPGMPPTINISPNLIQDFDEQHFCGTLEELAQHVREITASQFLGDTYPGVSIAINRGTLSVFDGTQTMPAPVQIDFTDLIGQPTWLDVGTMQFMTVMRGDLQVGTQIRMPAGFVVGPGSMIFSSSSEKSVSGLNYQVTFTGTFIVQALRHIGHFSSASGEEWATVVICTPTVPPSPTQQAAGV